MDTRSIEAELAQKYNYKRLPSGLSHQMRKIYRINLPDFLSIDGDYDPLYTSNGSLICNGYRRIVIGDYGAFIEFDATEATKNLIIQPGQEYRIMDPNYSKNVKYHWYTIPDGSQIKIYHQIRRVSYADYVPGKYYVSPHEVRKGYPMKKVLFTHIDMDGSGSEIMVRKYFPDIEVHRVDYGFDTKPENRRIMAEADMIVFTDISVTRDTAELLESTRQYGKNLILLDHHESAYQNLHDLGYSWIKIDQARSGALLTYQFFHDLNPAALEGYEELAELISDYDLWRHVYVKSRMLQFLWSDNADYFVNRFLENPKVEFDPYETEVISKSMTALDESYKLAVDSLKILTDCEGLKFGLVGSIGLLSSLAADRLMKEYPDLVYLVIINKKGSLSFRSLNYEVRKIAEAMGGGGHPLASGAAIPEGLIDIQSSVINRRWIKYDLSSKLGVIPPK